MRSIEEQGWSDLPYDLLDKIVKCVNPNRVDVLRFRSVCQSWRSSIPPFVPLTLPLPVPLPRPGTTSFDPKMFAGHGTVEESTLYLLESPNSQGFLVQVVGEGEEETRLITPLNRSRLDETTEFPKKINLLDFHISEICKSHDIKSHNFKNPIKYLSADQGFRKVALLGNVDRGYLVSGLYEYDTRHLSMCFLKQGDDKWCWVEDFDRLFPVDLITYKGKLFAVTLNGSGVAFDSKDHISVIASPIPGCFMFNGAYLVESLGDLYLLDLYGLKFRVYKLDEEEGQWIETTNLGTDRIFFVSPDYSFSISTLDFIGFKGNCIYESRSYLKGYENHQIKYSIVYDLEDGSVQIFHGHPLWPHWKMHLTADCNPTNDPMKEIETEDEGEIETEDKSEQELPSVE